MPGENMLQSEAFWLVLGALAGVLGAQMLAAHKHRKKRPLTGPPCRKSKPEPAARSGWPRLEP